MKAVCEGNREGSSEAGSKGGNGRTARDQR